MHLPAHGDDAAAQALSEFLLTDAPTRHLGRANALVARSLLLAPDASPIEGESAAAIELQATGWVAWVLRGSTAACRARAACSTRRACPSVPRRSRRCARGSRRSWRASPGAPRRPRRSARGGGLALNHLVCLFLAIWQSGGSNI